MKTRSTLFLLTFFISIFAISSCQKALNDSNIKYIGSWGSDKYSLEIWKDGRGVYERRNYGALQCRVIIENQKIKFRGNTCKTFTIDADPYTDVNGNTVMVLSGDTFYKH